MIILITFIAIFILSLIGLRKNTESLLFFVGFGLSGLLILIMIILMFAMRAHDQQNIVEYHSIKKTIEIQRRNNENNPIERAALINEIMKDNAIIASKKYWNETQWDLWIDDEITKLELLN